MKRENEKKLMDDFPELFSLKDDNFPYPIAFGIECGDGWFDIIYDLTKKIHAIAPQTKITQIKEKFGGLRYYVLSGTEEVWDLITETEKLSFKTCEYCGTQRGVKIRGERWLKVLCRKCEEKRKKHFQELMESYARENQE